MSARVRAALLLCTSTFAAIWAGVLLDAHRKAVMNTLQPGLLCGPEGGCGDVLTSQWATLGPVAVSTPAIPLFAAVAVLAGLVAAERLDARKVSSIATGAGLVGLAFGGWLLYHMLADVAHVCRYCLVMDAATAGVLATGALLHPDGVGAAFRGIADAARALVKPGPELATVGAVLLGTAIVTGALPEPAEAGTQAGAPVTVVAEGDKGAADAAQGRVIQIPAGHADLTFTDTTAIRGPADAPITITVFEDFQCPFCRKLTGAMEALREEDPSKIRIAWFHFPMHSACNARPGMTDMHADACGASIAAECARRQGKFWEYHDRLFMDQVLTADQLLANAKELGLDMTQFAACQADPTAKEKILADTMEGRKFNITGTPAWFVNGKRFTGTESLEGLRAITEAVLKSDGQQQVAVGTAKAVEEIIADPTDRPATVKLVGPRGPFTIDTYEASVVNGAAKSVAGVEPSRGLSWDEADAACKKAKKRLCAEDEWLTACTGQIPVDSDGDGHFSDNQLPGREQPYGAFVKGGYCATDRTRTDPRPLVTGNHPQCATPEGVMDLVGGVKEWVGTAPHLAALQGGSYFSTNSARCGFHKMNEAPDVKDPANGFRCCSGPAPELPPGPPGGRVGEKIQDWTLSNLDGGTISSKDLAGKPYIIVFWASWCQPCRKELPILADLYAKYHEKTGLEIVAVTIDTAAPAAKKFLTEQPLPFPIAVDPKSEFMRKFDATAPPTSFFVTKSGRIRQRNVGYDDKGGAPVIEASIRGLLKAE